MASQFRPDSSLNLCEPCFSKMTFLFFRISEPLAVTKFSNFLELCLDRKLKGRKESFDPPTYTLDMLLTARWRARALITTRCLGLG